MTPLKDLPVSPSQPTSHLTVAVGDLLQLANGQTRRWWWRVAATSPNFAVVTHQASFERKGTLCYSVLDWRRRMRGPCNLLTWGDGSYSGPQCAAMLREFESDRLALSSRNNVPLTVLGHRPYRPA